MSARRSSTRLIKEEIHFNIIARCTQRNIRDTPERKKHTHTNTHRTGTVTEVSKNTEKHLYQHTNYCNMEKMKKEFIQFFFKKKKKRPRPKLHPTKENRVFNPVFFFPFFQIFVLLYCCILSATPHPPTTVLFFFFCVLTMTRMKMIMEIINQ